MPGSRHRLPHHDSETALLREALQQFHTLLDQGNFLVFTKDLEGRYTYVNQAMERLISRPYETIIGSRDVECFDDRGSGHLRKHDGDTIAEGKPITRSYSVSVRPAGSLRAYQVNQVPLRNEQGQVVGVGGVATDITEVRATNERLRFAASVFHYASEAIMLTDRSGTILEVNEAFTRITGYAHDEVVGQNPRILNSGRQDKAFYQAMWASLEREGTWYGEVWNRRKNGEFYIAMETISTVRNAAGEAHQYVALFSDITRQKEAEHRAEHAVHYDVLTSLPNRLLLADRMQQMLLRARRYNEMVAVLSLDIDGFKEVNDAHGHQAGDRLLIESAVRIQDCLRTEDTVSRIGGDEFVVLLGGVASRAACEQTIGRILSELQRPFHIGEGGLVSVSGSIGYTLFPEDDVDSDTLLRHADQAMYSAKQAGKNRFHRFDVKLDNRTKANWSAISRIQRALDAGEFRLYVQPKAALATGQVVGAEALIRWQHPIRGLVPPAQFIPLIAGQDFAVTLGNWVLARGMALLEDWQRAGIVVPLSVNVDARQLREADFSSGIARLLETHPQVPSELLEIEIVESAALDDVQKVSALIDDCHALGVSFSLDDFGTGYSSLTYLKRLAVDTLKIDQSFVRDMLGDDSAMAIVRGVIGLAQAFRSHTVAEGVETWEHAARLKQAGCDTIQGYVLARPMPAEDFPAWVAGFKMPPL